jgi:DNA (cytosine-5)-methyltransferase 1
MEKRFAYREKIGRNGVGAGCLSEQVEWSKEGSPIGYMTKTMWPTPVTSDHAARRPSKGWEGKSDLPSVVWTNTGGTENPNLPPARLNPNWVEWLMGWAIGWTDLKPLEMDKSLSVQQPLGSS